MDNIVRDLVSQMVDSISKQKEDILKSKILNKFQDFNFEEEKKRRFKKLVCEVDYHGNETYYYNDGTTDGCRLVTFFKFEPQFELGSNKMNFELKYS